MSWVENSEDWMILAQGLTCRKIIQFRRNIEVKCYKYRKTVKECEKKAVVSKKKILKDTQKTLKFSKTVDTL